MDSFQISLGKPEDIDRLYEIERAVFTPPWAYNALYSELINEDTFFPVASCDGRDVGFLILRRIVDVGEILNVAVSEDFRGLGIGQALLNAGLDYVRENKLTTVFLEVRKSNLPAISLYTKNGFIPTRLRRDYYTSPTEDAVEMLLEVV